jgi:hypothetical protein
VCSILNTLLELRCGWLSVEEMEETPAKARRGRKKKIEMDSDEDDPPSPPATKKAKTERPPVVKTLWTEYKAKIAKLLASRKRSEQRGQFDEARLVASEVKDALRLLLAENSHHVRHPEFDSSEADFSVDNIFCSNCQGSDSEANDLYFCDNIGCNRAYHLKCLEPPLTPADISANPEEYWFCHQCNCAADCLILINKAFKTSFLTPDECLKADLPIDTSQTPKKKTETNKAAPATTSQSKKGKKTSNTPQKIPPLDFAITESGPTLIYAPNSFWGQTYTLVKRLVGDIARLHHFVTVASTQSQSDVVVLVDDLQRNLNRLRKRKLEVREALLALCEHNRSHKRYSQLDEDDEEGMVELGEIYCSKCGGPDTETNDIYICDRKGCCRAYHAACLDPPLNPSDISTKPEEDWFCWECRCLADCLVVLNEAIGTSYDGEAGEVFAEVVHEKDEAALLTVGEEGEEDDDQEYVPKEKDQAERPELLSDHDSDESRDSDSGEEEEEAEEGTNGNGAELNDEDSEVSDDEVSLPLLRSPLTSEGPESVG